MKLVRILISAVVCLGGLELRGDTIYSTTSAYQSAFSGGTFASPAFTVGNSYTSPYTDSTTGAVFSLSNGGSLSVNSALGGAWGSAPLVVDTVNNSVITINTIPSTARGFELLVGGSGGNQYTTDFTLAYTAGGTTNTYTFTPSGTGTPYYFGVQTTSAISSITLTPDYSFQKIQFSGLDFGTQGGGGGGGGSSTPEASTSLLIGLGLVSLGVAQKKLRASVRNG